MQQSDWENPFCEDWVEALERTLLGMTTETVLAAHSLGCLLVAHWAAKTRIGAKGALLVAPPDPEGPNYPKQAVGFSPLPLKRLAFPSIVVASANDPYGTLSFAQRIAAAWGSGFVNIGAVGHINADSGLGDWPEGLSLLRRLAHEKI